MKRTFLYIFAMLGALVSCDRMYDTPTDDDRLNAGINDPEPKFYMEQYDPISDQGQFWHPDVVGATPNATYGYQLAFLGASDRNDPTGSALDSRGLPYHLLGQSFAGLTVDFVASGQSPNAGNWTDVDASLPSIKRHMVQFGYPITWGMSMRQIMIDNPDGYAAIDGDLLNRMTGKHYVLTDVDSNPESGIVAIVASHVHSALIIDKKDEAAFQEKGWTMVYDASTKSTADAFHEFKDQCNNNALVMMPVHTGELADFAIANKLFVINFNKQNGTADGGQNKELLKEVLAWLEPNSPVYGWETGIGEDEFVIPVSESGNMMVAASNYNVPYLSRNYKNRQTQVLAKVVNPQDIDYDMPGRFTSFYLSDGANCGFMEGSFEEEFLNDVNTENVCMSYGITGTNLCQYDPLQFETLINMQNKRSTYIESFGGGYWYSDNFGNATDRSAVLKSLAEKVAAHMRQHRIKILEQIAIDPTSPEAIETYQAFVDANDQLEGIVAIQYAPSYAEKGGEIVWVTNKAGYDIPVVTVSYSIWNFGNENKLRDGTPTYVAHRINEDESKFVPVIVHAWSTFKDTGDSSDELAENAVEEGAVVRGASAAEMCARRLDEDVHVVNMQELIWRIRMEYRPEQTQKYLSEYF